MQSAALTPKGTRRYYAVVTPEGAKPEVQVSRAEDVEQLSGSVLQVYNYPFPLGESFPGQQKFEPYLKSAFL